MTAIRDREGVRRARALAAGAALMAAAVPLGAPHPVPAQEPVPAARFEAHNPLDLRRDDEVVALPWPDLARALPGLTADAVRVVREGADTELPSQTVDLDGDGTPEQLLFLARFWPRETLVVRVEAATAAPVAPRVHVYHDAERDDVAWESDRIAFRTYGQGLWALEDLVSSGIDVLTKRVPDLVLERWYADGDYHTDTGEGADFFSVGSTLGAGGTGIWRDGALHRAGNFADHRILADGPIRAVVELVYDPYPAGELTVSETRRISIDAGSNLFRQETRLTVGGGAPEDEVGPLVRAVGIVRRPDLVSAWSPGSPWPWLAGWQPVGNGGHGHLGTAVLVPVDGDGTAAAPDGAGGVAAAPNPRDVDGHAVLLTPVRPGRDAVHYVGAGWTAAGAFPHPEAWWRYLDQAARRLVAPIVVRPVGVESAP